MTRTLVVAAMTTLLLASCGGNEAGSESNGGATGNDAGTSEMDGGAGGAVVDAPPAGQAAVSVDGLNLSFQEPGGIVCNITDEAFSYSFRIGDNEVTLGAGANLSDQGWLGAIQVVVANPDDGAGPVSYFPDLAAHGDGIAVEGDSMSYSGPMMKQPPQDGTNPAPVEVGDGSISATCP